MGTAYYTFTGIPNVGDASNLMICLLMKAGPEACEKLTISKFSRFSFENLSIDGLKPSCFACGNRFAEFG